MAKGYKHKNKKDKTKEQIQKEKEKIKDTSVEEFEDMFKRARPQMEARTAHHKFFDRVAHMLNLYDEEDVIFSEGSTQAIQRKIRSQTLQRVPDGELSTQYDDNHYEQLEMEFLFKNKVLMSEFDGKDMLKNLWRTFDTSYIFGFGCVRTGFEKDSFNEVRISYTDIPYTHLYPNPDCKFIEEANWYIVEEMISWAELEGLLDEKGHVIDKTWNEDTIKYILENDHKDSPTNGKNAQLADDQHGVHHNESVKIHTLYRRGDKEFITYVPSLQAKLRTVKNYDPRLDIPLHFMILEPDPSFPLGCSSVMWTLTQQQFADTFQSTAYNALLLALNPPLLGWGNSTPESYLMEPGAFWNQGLNPNAKIEKFPVETTTITQYGSIQEQVSASMMKNMNITDQTVASDANVPGWSKTPQGVEQQKLDKTITVNQYQKRVEIFFSEFCNHAIRSYVGSMTGKHTITVDEDTRRRIWDYEETLKDPKNPDAFKSIVDGNKIVVNFSELNADRIQFKVRAGSLIAGEKEEQRKAIQEMLVPVSQMMGNVSDQNKNAFEDVIMQLVKRLIELSDVDVAVSSGKRFEDRLVIDTLFAVAKQLQDTDNAVRQLQNLSIAQLPQNPQQNAQQNPQAQLPMPATETQLPAPQQAPVPTAEERDQTALPPEVMQTLLSQAQTQNAPQPAPMPQNNEEEMAEEV